MSHYRATAAFFARLVSLGTTDVVVSPGMRSAPLALTARATAGLRIHVIHDERVAGFVALGIAKASGRPVVTMCTSGSAVANLLPAVVEAHHGRVPLLVVTGDRPPELHGWDSPQTIDQRGIFSSFATPFVVDSLDAAATATEAWATAQRVPAGPVHVNWPFAEPLEPSGVIAVPVEEPRTVAQAAPSDGVAPDRRALEALADLIGRRRGVIAVGEVDAAEAGAAVEIARRLGWPLLADPLSGLRRPDAVRNVITTFDHLLGNRSWADAHVPDVVLRVGSPPTSKNLRLWMERTRPPEVVVLDPAGRRRDPSRTMTRLVAAGAVDLADLVVESTGDDAWGEEWSSFDVAARDVVAEVAGDAFEEAAATRATASALGPGDRWHVASSTPIRDVDWYVAGTHAVVGANRGANGIDGTVSTAMGLGLGGNEKVVVTIGDVALVHDVGGLLAAGRSARPPTVVVYDNGGGGIFSLLPIVGAVDSDAFREVLHTPTRVDIAALAGACGYRYERVESATALTEAVSGDPRVVHVPVTIEGSRAQLEAVRRRVAELS